MFRKFILLALVSALSATAYAQRTKTIIPDLNAEGKAGEIARAQFKKALERFDKGDEDKDGFISKAESDKNLGEYERASFDDKDKNKDGRLSWEEYLGHDRWKKDALK